MTCSENQVSKPIAPSFYVIIIITNILVLQIKFVLGGKKVTGTKNVADEENLPGCQQDTFYESISDSMPIEVSMEKNDSVFLEHLLSI